MERCVDCDEETDIDHVQTTRNQNMIEAFKNNNYSNLLPGTVCFFRYITRSCSRFNGHT